MTLIFWLQFAAVCIAGAISPGPSLALIIRNSIKYNRLTGIITAVGHGLGMGIYAIFAVTGLSIILTTNIYIFKSIQIAGIVLLFVYGILFIVQKNKDFKIENNQKKFNSFLQGFSISILNPKILIWFSAVFSQFIISESTLLTNSILILTASIIDGMWYILVALIVTSYSLKDFFKIRVNTIQNVSGTILVIISLLLIIDFF
tara:strand:- start:398 stop:1006 length:609 start_codon:yes stop_codon:yes gene_type:complete